MEDHNKISGHHTRFILAIIPLSKPSHFQINGEITFLMEWIKVGKPPHNNKNITTAFYF